jgi:hypothetical protein
MHRIIFFLATIGFGACNSNTINYYIVRHAEKAIVDLQLNQALCHCRDKEKKERKD